MAQEIKKDQPMFLIRTSEVVLARAMVARYCGEEHPLTERLKDDVTHLTAENGAYVPCFSGGDKMLLRAVLRECLESPPEYESDLERPQAALLLRIDPSIINKVQEPTSEVPALNLVAPNS
ncbi:MAG: hypothetical protein V4702_04830 [Patescibacteria group bacterium]